MCLRACLTEPDLLLQSVVQMSGFRSLGDDEEVEFECKVSDKGLEATVVTGPDGTDCQGSHRRPAAKKRFRKIRLVAFPSPQLQTGPKTRGDGRCLVACQGKSP